MSFKLKQSYPEKQIRKRKHDNENNYCVFLVTTVCVTIKSIIYRSKISPSSR